MISPLASENIPASPERGGVGDFRRWQRGPRANPPLASPIAYHPSQPATEWYDDGLRFECTSCGACCTGPPGAVRFTTDEANAMARALAISSERFMDEYTHDTPAGRSLKETRTEHGYDCVFLDRITLPGKAICGIYPARPAQCRTFPFWPEHLRSPREWQRLSRRCEGIGKGHLIPIEHIRIQRDA